MIPISSTARWPGCALSNFAAHDFEFEGVMCASMEGLLQSFKFKDEEKQRQLCALTGFDAKHIGRAGNGWKASLMLYWKGTMYDRYGEEYQKLLDRAFLVLSANPAFRSALMATGHHSLVHPMGSDDPAKTVLTRDEFVDRLTQIRQMLRN